MPIGDYKQYTLPLTHSHSHSHSLSLSSPSLPHATPLLLTIVITRISTSATPEYDCYLTDITRLPPLQGGAYSMEIELTPIDTTYRTWRLAQRPFTIGDFGADADPEEVGEELRFVDVLMRTSGFDGEEKGEEGEVMVLVRLGDREGEDVLVTKNWDGRGEGIQDEVDGMGKGIADLDVSGDKDEDSTGSESTEARAR